MRGATHSHQAEPLVATLERISAIEIGKLDLSARPTVPEEPGWFLVSDLAADGDILRGVFERVERGYAMGDRTLAGTALLRSVLWRTLTPAVAALLTERRLPDLSAANVALRFGESGFAEGLAFNGARLVVLPGDLGGSKSVVSASEEAFLVRLRAAVAEDFLENLIPALRALRVRRSRRALWSVGVDVCAEAFMFVGQGLGREDEACAFGRKLLGVSPLAGSVNYFTFEYDGGSMLSRVRNTCCLHYTLGNGACFTCPRTSDEERLRRLRKG